MRKKLLQLTTIALIMFLGACSNEEIINENDKGVLPEPGRTVSLSVNMPVDNPATRVALTQDEDLAITLTWEDNDQLQLVFVQGDIKEKKTVTVKNISEDRKKADFDIELPTGITGNFDLYGVYGGGGLSDDNPTLAKLPVNAGDAGSLASVKERKYVMIYFSSKNMEISDKPTSVDFKHLGSLFSVTVKNTDDSDFDLNGLAEARLIGVGGSDNWAYNVGAGGKTFDLVSGEFQDIESGGNFISLKANKNSLSSGESITFWGWYPPVPNKTWPKLYLDLLNAGGTSLHSTTDEKTVQSPIAGNSYYLTVEWDGSELNFPVEPNVYEVIPMGSLGTMLNQTQKDTITTMIVRGQLNKADFEVMRREMPLLRYLNLKDVICDKNEIPEEAFGSLKGGTQNKTVAFVTLPESITSIGDWAFGLTIVKGPLHLPAGLTSIGVSAFRSLTFLEGLLVLPAPLTIINAYAFNECMRLTGTLTIPDKVTSIDKFGFNKCTGFTSLDLSGALSLDNLQTAAFQDCSELTGTVTFPPSLTYINTYAFRRADKITAFRFPHTTPIEYTNGMLAAGVKVEVPMAAVAAYEAADGWKDHPIVGY